MQEFAKLCCHIVEEFYGSFLAHIFWQLAQHGRLSLQQVAQKCRLPLRQIKSGVATLIQLRLVHHHTSSEGLSIYQANSTNAYNIMRTGRLVELVNWKLGSHAAHILETLAGLGFATAHELEAQVLGDKDLAASIDRDGFRTMLRQLIQLKYVNAVREAHFQAPHDARQDVERSLRDAGMLSASTGKKIKDDADAKIDVELEKQCDGSIESAPAVLRELDAGPTQDNTTLSIDYSSLVIRTRNSRIIEVAEKMFGTQVAQVAQAACLQVEHTNPKSLPMRLAEDPSSAVQQLNISKLSSDASGTAINGHSQHNDVNGHHKRRVNGTAGEDRMVERNLAVLAEGSFTFLLQDTDDTRSWCIDKLKFNKFVWDKEMYRLIGETLTEPTLRIVRMLADKGKLDEKVMQEVGLLNPKELRKSLAALQKMGFLELQEVPKDPHRLPKNTFFLYFYDPERVRKVFVEKLYKSMVRMYQQLHLERIKIASTLGKLDRLDMGTEVEILSAAELQVFYSWQQKESWFTTEIHRMDDSISILRDI